MSRQLFCAACVLVLSTLASSQTSSPCPEYPTTPNEVVLLDTSTLTTLPWTAQFGANLLGSTGCGPVVELCVPDEAYFVYTQFISKTTNVSVLNVVVYYESGMCSVGDTSGECTFNLLLHNTSTAVGTDILSNFRNYINVDTVRNGERIPVTVEENGFYLGFYSQMICVNITRVIVSYTTCPSITESYVEYPQSSSGQIVTGTCISNSVPVGNQALMAYCNLTAGYQFLSGGCECMAGYQPSSDQSSCKVCPSGMFKLASGSSSCIQCPSNSDSVSGSTNCTCNEGYQRPSGSTVEDSCSECVANYFQSSGSCSRCPSNSMSSGGTSGSCTCSSNTRTQSGNSMTSGDSCSRCAADYYRSGQGCMGCPLNSERPFTGSEDESMCTCSGNSSTSNGASTTSSDPCSGCKQNFFVRQSGTSSAPPVCASCPSNSMSSAGLVNSCQCVEGSIIEGTSTTMTTEKPCSGCVPGKYRAADNNVCLSCPPNSNRTQATDPQEICPCFEGYIRRSNPDPGDKCAPFIGFNVSSVEFGEGSHSIAIVLTVDARTTVNFDVPYDVDNGDDYVPSPPLSYPFNSRQTNIQISVPDNEIALQAAKKFTITLQSTEDAVVRSLNSYPYSSIEVTITDMDSVDVGFTVNKVRYNESEKGLSVNITSQVQIASSFILRIKAEGGSGLLKIADTVEITPAATTVPESFEIIDNFDGGMGDRTVTLTLEFVGPENFRNLVVIGGGSTHKSIEIVIADDDAAIPPSPFPVAGIVGASVAAAGLAVLLLIIVILCFCIFRLQVNRQGFYPTYEDKTSEPPTMLRYSASLRSISSQTVVGVNEGKSVSRENEFYV